VGEHDGQRYFSMKLVEGGSLAEQGASFTKDPKSAATLLAETAEAVHHAHMRGILHRDLKPANILVDAQGHPHVTDFGLAKRVEDDVEMTQSGAILGTPAYMSPEQAAGRRGTITTATDVYGLGAILYALLTGKAPFGGSSVMETLDAVRTRPPEAPKRINAKVPRDPETICLKCLEKDPRRRYTSAQALADDLRRWLDGRPIAARPVGAIERTIMWCRRKPALTAFIALFLLATVGGIGAVIIVQARANRKLTAANARIKQRYALATEAIRTFHTGVSEDFLLKEERFKSVRDRLLKSAIDFYGKLETLLDKEEDLESRRALSQASWEVANLTGDVGRPEDAIAAHRKVLAAREAVRAQPGSGAAASADVARSLISLGKALDATGKTAEARACFESARDTLLLPGGRLPADAGARDALARSEDALALALMSVGRKRDGVAELQRARDIRIELLKQDPRNDNLRRDLAGNQLMFGNLLGEIGRAAEAEAEYRGALAIFQELAARHPDHFETQANLSSMHNNLGMLLAATGRSKEAEGSLREALRLRQRLVDANPAVAGFRLILSNSHNVLGNLLREIGRMPEAEGEYRAALAIQQRLADEYPDVTGYGSRLAGGRNNLGTLLEQMGRADLAEAEGREAVRAAQGLAGAHPDVVEFQKTLADLRGNYGRLHRRLGKTTRAADELRESLRILRKLVADHPANTAFQSGLANAHSSLGALLQQQGKPGPAEAEEREAIQVFQKLTEDNPNLTESRISLANSHRNLSSLLNYTGRPGEAEAEQREAIRLQQKLSDDNPTVTEFRDTLAMSHNTLGILLYNAGKPEQAVTEFRAVQKVFEEMVATNPKIPDYRDRLAMAHNNLAEIRREMGRLADALDGYDRGIALQDGIVKDQPNVVRFRNSLGIALRGRGLVHLASNDPARAAADTVRALELFDGLPARSGAEWFETACCHATLARLAGRAAPGLTAEQEGVETERAMDSLREAFALGYRDLATLRHEAALVAIRERPDFRLLMMDLAMPPRPFAR
jgi:tetratricopeptide (TPR) repeat protein